VCKKQNKIMAEDASEGFWMDDLMDDDVIVQTKRKSNPRKMKKDTERNVVAGDDKSKAFTRLFELDIPKSDQTILSKLISNGQLTSVNKVLHRKKNSIILSGKVNRTHRNFPLLSSDDAIIKILINGNKNELWQRAYDEFNEMKSEKYDGDESNKQNRPQFLIQTGNIIVMSMIGKDGEPAPTLKDILSSKERKVAEVYNEVFQFWCKIRHRTFHPTNILYHNGTWWTVGYGAHAYDAYHTDSSFLLSFYRTNLKRLIDFFCHYGLSIKEAEFGFMKYKGNYYWSTIEAMRGMTQKRSFFSLMYM